MDKRALAIALAAALFAFSAAASAAHSDEAAPQTPPQQNAAGAERAPSGASTPPHPLPAPVTTSHEVDLPGRSLHFHAIAGAIPLSDAQSGEPQADVAYVAFLLDGADPATRPISFVVNGGPGAASAWLNLGAMGPWRLNFGSPPYSPSAPAIPIDNSETWLDFTDLVFIDPPGTGYSRILAKGDGPRRHFYSVEGDIEALAVVIRKWLAENKRLAEPEIHRRRKLWRLSRAETRAAAAGSGGRRRQRHRDDLAGHRLQLVRGRQQPFDLRHAPALAGRRRAGP